MSTFNNKSAPALIFIPDISGYTKFVNSTEILHAKHILEELLEVLMNANEINLELSEIEGDALLFYRKGKAPNVDEMMRQVELMYIKFHEYLKQLETHRICSCGACSTANNLTIKFVAHYGEVAENHVKDRFVLFGKEVIVAHHLLKNEVPSNSYGLLSKGLMEACDTYERLSEVSVSEVVPMEEEYDFGKANYSYIELESLKDRIKEPKIEDYNIKGATKKIFQVEQIVEALIDLAFNVLSDYSIRHEYSDGLIDSDMLNHKITQNGSTHRCVIKQDENDPQFVAHNYTFNKNKITFVESSENQGLTSIYKLIAIDEHKTRIEVNAFIKPSFFKLLVFNLFFKKKVRKSAKLTMYNLNELCKKLVTEELQHSSQIVLPDEVIDYDSVVG